jgi:hypothetical protein
VASSGISDLLRVQRAQLQGLVELRGVRRMLPIYQKARADLERRVRAAGRGDASFTAYHLRVQLAQVRDAIHVFQEELAGHLHQQGKTASVLSQRHLVGAVKSLERKFSGHTPVLQLEQAAVFRKVYQGVEPSLLDRYKRSSALYGPPVVAKMRDQLSLAILQDETVDQATDRIMGTFDGERYRAERIARTEMSYGYHVVKHRAMEQMRQSDVPDLQKTMISTFDGREGEDAKEQQMQIREVNEPFEYTHKDGKVTKYMAPPNRPHDRATMIPWRPGWSEGSVPNRPGDAPPTTAGLPPAAAP